MITVSFLIIDILLVLPHLSANPRLASKERLWVHVDAAYAGPSHFKLICSYLALFGELFI